MTRTYYFLLLLFTVFTPAIPCIAQFDFSVGPHLAYPMVITNQGYLLNAGHLGAGVRLGVDYNTNKGPFSPSLRLSFGQHRLPLQQNEVHQGSLSYSVSSLILNVNYTSTVNERKFLLYGGLGAYRIKLRKIVPSGSDNDIVSIDSSADITKFFPAANIGFEYRGVTTGKRFYLATGISLSYVKLFKGYNKYYLTVLHENKIRNTVAYLQGNLLSPAIYLVLSYKYRSHRNDHYIED